MLAVTALAVPLALLGLLLLMERQERVLNRPTPRHRAARPEVSVRR